MSYQTGTFTNSHELINIIYGFLIGAGWTVVSTLKQTAAEPDGYDHVYYSTGDNGSDIYIRIAAGLSDRVSNSIIQHPFDDGYTEYINGLAYQYFPNSGTSDQGCSELGRYGPVLYATFDDDCTFFEYNLFTSSLKPMITRVIKERTSGFTTVEQGGLFAFEGGYLYQAESPSDVRKVNIVTGDLTSINVWSPSYGSMTRSITGRKRDGTKYTMHLVSATAVGERAAVYNIETNTWSLIPGPAGFTSQYPYGISVQGVKRKRFINDQPGHQFAYMSQGDGSTNWAYYNVDDQHWSATNITPALPLAGGGSRASYGVYIMKEASGYDHDRIYYFQGGNGLSGFTSIEVGPDGYVGDTWTTHTNTPQSQFSPHRAFASGKFIFWQASDGELYRWRLPTNPHSTGTWEKIYFASFFTPSGNEIGFDPGGLFEVHDHLCNRIRVSEFQTNTYWLFADKNRVVVVVKNAEGKYNYLYTGQFQPYSDSRVCRLTAPASAGARTITVDNPDMFKVGSKYIIAETKGGNIVITSELTEEGRTFAPSQSITVLGIAGNDLSITALNYHYSTGSVVGEDPVPTMTRVQGMDRAQTLNNMSVYRSNIFSDPAWQTYDLLTTMDSDVMSASVGESRSSLNFMYPIILKGGYAGFTGLNSAGTLQMVGHPNDKEMISAEARGQLIDVYETGTGISSETVIPVGSKNYLAFNIEESTVSRVVVIGPIN